MNWYNNVKLALPLDPDAWQKHDVTHRLMQDQPVINTPFGIINQRSKSQKELEQNYAGVHASKNIEIAAIYANNLGTRDDPPIVLEIATSQEWENDIDALHAHIDQNMLTEWVDEINIAERIKENGNSRNIIEDIMSEISNIDLYIDPESVDTIIETIYEQNQNIGPSAIIDYFESYYNKDDPVKAFYEKFILPIYFNKGDFDNRIIGWMINQMRFMKPIVHSEIEAIYIVERFSDEIKTDYDDDESYDEQGRRQLMYEDIVDGGLVTKEIWRNPQKKLFDIFDVFYHGTTVSRGQQALPELNNILLSIRNI